MTKATGSAVLCGMTVLVVGLAAQQAPQLPEPFATPSASNQSKSVPRPPAAQLKVPTGFRVSMYADDLRGPRTMIFGPNGDLFVAESRAGSIVILRDTNHDGSPDQRFDYATGLQNPFGMAFHEGYFYVGETTRVVRFKYEAGDTKAPAAEELATPVAFPSGGHSTRNVIFSRDGRKMYVAVGSLSNKSAGEPELRAAVNEYNPDGSGHRIYASGLRNPVGLTLQPGTDTIWVSVNERDTLGDDLVPDYTTSVKDGGFYGWPYYYIGSHPDPEHKGQRPDLAARVIVPDVLLPSHGAAVSVAFYTGTQFPERYRNGAMVGLHGSWNRSKAAGYKVVFIPFQDGKPAGPAEDLLSGWLVSEGPGPITTWGRPVGTTVMPDGSVLVADDGTADNGGRLWRITYDK